MGGFKNLSLMSALSYGLTVAFPMNLPPMPIPHKPKKRETAGPRHLSRSKYMPHQGEQEKARRVRRMMKQAA